MMMARLICLALLAPGASAIATISATTLRLSRPQPAIRMSAPQLEGADLMAARGGGKRFAVSGLQPTDSQGQEYVGVPPPGSEAPMPPSLVQRAKGPFMGLTLAATAAIAAWQSNRAYRQRQQTLLADFGATLVFHRGDTQEMQSAIRDFRTKLGPGSYRAPMFQAFLVALAVDVPIGVKTITSLKDVAKMMRLTDAAAATTLESAAAELQGQPSMLGKLVFVAERAMPTASSMAKLRSRFPNWSLDTVTALQRAMLEGHYRELISGGGSVDAPTLEVLGLSEAEAARIREVLAEEKKVEEAAAAEAAAEEEERLKLQRALEKASAPPPNPLFDDEPETEDPKPASPVMGAGSSTHEYECTKCGYTLFPAGGREFKFFGDDFKCPQCGAGKEDFVDNGPV